MCVPPRLRHVRLFEERFSQVASSRVDQGVELGEEGESPHEVAAHDGQDERRPPQTARGETFVLARSIDGRACKARGEGTGRIELTPGFLP